MVNPFNWNVDQWKAASRHVVTAVGAVVGTLVFTKVLPQAAGESIVANVKIIFDSLSNIITATGAIIVSLGPIWSLIRSTQSASPERQVEATVKNLASGVPLNGKRDLLIAAVANQPDVAKIEMVDKTVAQAIPSEKVK